MANHKQHQQQKLHRLSEALIQRVADLPAILTVSAVAVEFGRPADTIRKQIRRGTFPVRVQECGGERFVTLADYVRFLETGDIQTQDAPKRRAGRPSNASRLRQGGQI